MLINKLTSTFGDHSSLLPLFTKDVVNSAGMTAFSYDAGGKIEAKDRFIDEFGTQAIWIGGLPFFKWAFDKTVYKMAKMAPDVDVRLLKDKDQYSVAQKYAQSLENKKYSETLVDSYKNIKKAKGLFFGKFAAATALTLASFFTLVKVKQHYTKKQIEKQFWAKKSEEHFYNDKVAKSPAFKAFMHSEGVQGSASKNVSFKGQSLGAVLKGFMFDPVQNLFIVDAGITGERLVNSRTKTEFAETAIKEGSLLFFLYCAGKFVQEGIEKLSEMFGKPIGLHAEVLASSDLHKSINSGKVNSDIKAVTDLADNKKALYEFIYDSKNADNIVIKAAKQSKIIKTIVNGTRLEKLKGKAVDTGIINPHQYINPEEILGVANNIKKLSAKAPAGEKLGDFLKSCRNMKIGSVAANMGITCLFLGLIVPYSMMKYREKQQNGNKEFHVQSEIEKQLEKNFKGRIA